MLTFSKRFHICLLVGLVVAAGGTIGCQPNSEPHAPDDSIKLSSSEHGPEKLVTQHLPNVVRLDTNVMSGGLPADESAFQELKSLGVKTLVCVDGAQPDVEMAARFGMSYVHLPHGYDGIPAQRAEELAKAVSELDGPIYVHCHHGKHRSPAAAAVACVGAGLIPESQALTVLKLAGTGEEYLGLYRSAREAKRFEKSLLDELAIEFQSSSDVPPMAEAMVDLEQHFHYLQDFSANQWKLLSNHSDLDPAHEALILHEHFTELLRTEEVQQYPEEFSQWLVHSESSGRQLETILQPSSDTDSSSQSSDAPTADTPVASPARTGDQIRELDRLLKGIASDCRECHRVYRNVPRDQTTPNH